MLFAFGTAVVILFLLYIFSVFTVWCAKRLYPPAGSFVEAEGVRLHVHDAGNGQPIVFLHGGVLWGEDFKEASAWAVRQGYRALAFDRPGYGYSGRFRKGITTPKDQARLLHGALHQLGAERPILVAHSWSGVLALTYALDYPDELSGLVIIGGGMYRKHYPAAEGDLLSKLVTMPILGSLFLYTLLVPMGRLLSSGMMRATFAPEPVPPEYGRAVRALWFRPGQFRANREDVLAFAQACDDISERYGEITVPVVIAAGEADPFPTLVHSTWLHREIPHSKLIMHPDAGHMIPQLHPGIVMDSIQMLISLEQEGAIEAH
ncbi:alpha/beta fold hydrolase [Paenibacillus ihbetae]|uniref:AB hydrolase-1 domain-containing protein n=1 Tax=Paenibacillus ihbetae TaxID=1870820 RepID=A0A1B2E3J5_9BACL|nr:alpha/beta hydrolase [Paenibacillus ihbetae]ANY74511.1 hypothetical protein BBD41_19130 [Paenibacillus ihbetae]OOC63307.1 hypothetical protein BBD40_16425 [Paenibacillus ihbetae]